MPALVLELIRRPNKPDVPFLDQVEERYAASDVLLRHADHQPCVRPDQMLLRRLTICHQLAQRVYIVHRQIIADFFQLFPRQFRRLHPLCQRNFFFGGQ